MVEWAIDGPGALESGILTTPASEAPLFARSSVTANLDGLSASAEAVISVRTQAEFAPQLFNLSHQPLPRQLDFRPTIEKIDVFFLIDTPIYIAQDHLPAFADRALEVIAPQLLADGYDAQFGAGRFSAFPLDGAGEENCGPGQTDQPFELWSEISPGLDALEAGLSPAIKGGPLGCNYQRGAFGEALYQIATGEGFDGPGATYVEPNIGPRGGVGFREDSLALVLSTVFHHQLTGLEFLPFVHDGAAAKVAHSAEETVEALQAADILHIGHTNNPSTFDGYGPLHALMEVAADTGARVPPEAWNHPTLGRPSGCAEGECCLDRAGDVPSDFYGFCPMGSRYHLQADPPSDPTDNIIRDLYALTHYLLTDVTATATGEAASVSGVPLPKDTTSASFITVEAVEADAPPLDDAPSALLEDGVFRDVVPNTNLNYVVTIDPEVVPAVEGEPRLYRAYVEFKTGYRAGSRTQEFWIISPPL